MAMRHLKKYARFSYVLFAVVMLALLVSACAQQSKSITVYTAIEDDQYPTYLEDFAKEHPDIEVNLVRDSTGVITARFLAEKENPQADVVWGISATSLLVADTEGMLEPYSPKGLDRVLPEFRDSRTPPHWVGIDIYMTGICVNTVEMEALGLPYPESYEDLLDPVYKGYFVMPNPNSSGTGFLTVNAWLQIFGEEGGWAYMDKLHENVDQYMHSGSKPCKMAGAGEYPLGISFALRGITQARKGEPVVTIFPKEGSGYEMEANALVKKDKINPAAKTFLDWAISDSVMKLYAKQFSVTSVPTGEPVPEGFIADPAGQLIDSDFAWAAANRSRILEEWLRRYDSKSAPQD